MSARASWALSGLRHAGDALRFVKPEAAAWSPDVLPKEAHNQRPVARDNERSSSKQEKAPIDHLRSIKSIQSPGDDSLAWASVPE